MKSHPGTVHHVAAADRGVTLAAFLRQRLGGASWSRVQKLVRGRQVLIHGNICTDPARRLGVGEVVKVLEVAAPKLPAAGDVRIVHLDDDVVVVDKPPGVTTTRHHEERDWPARRRQLQPTLEELVPEAIAGLQPRRPRGPRDGRRPPAGEARRKRTTPVKAVHRIDRETSGLVAFARNVPAARILAEQFRLHTTSRRYLAVVVGRVNAGLIRTHLVRDRGDGRRGSAEDGEGKLAVTHVTPVEHFGDAYTLVECRLETGRTHQIRIHMAETGHPVCGERVYGPRERKAALRDESRAPRIMLHAAHLGFVHPVSGAELALESPLPADMRAVIASLRKRFP
jgi:23S rRNA pseudouridine1911/1915/1917 synthase